MQPSGQLRTARAHVLAPAFGEFRTGEVVQDGFITTRPVKSMDTPSHTFFPSFFAANRH